MMDGRRWRVTLLSRTLVLLALAVLGCSSVPAPPADAAADHSIAVAIDLACGLRRPYSSKNAPCNACAGRACCGVVNTCLADLECDDGYVNCTIACTFGLDGGVPAVKACLADCARQHPRGAAEYEAAIGCVDKACAKECA